jgi:hypothetical protein
VSGAVITAGALHAQREHATYLAGRGARYLLIVKRNQPGLHAQLAALPWRDVPVAHTSRERGYGRTERRALKVTAVARGLQFPHTAEAIQITRRRKVKGKGPRETCYAVTSLTLTQASHAQLAAIIRRGLLGAHLDDHDRTLSPRTHRQSPAPRAQIRNTAGPAPPATPASQPPPLPASGVRAAPYGRS